MSPKKKQKPKSLPKTKIKPPKAYSWTKSQKKLYKEITGKAQAAAGEAAGLILRIYNDVLKSTIDTFAEELGISDDGNSYDTDAKRFRFVRQEKKEAE